MNVSAFTIVRDATRLYYPVVESITSILPLVDEFVVLVGDSCDNTLEVIRGIDSPKLVVRESVWDPTLRTNGAVLAQQTNLALDLCRGDWCFYLQADEVIHENDWDRIRGAMQRHRDARHVDGLSFRYHHFVGDYHIKSLLMYKSQVRIVRNGLGIRSVKDACGFAREGRRLRRRQTGAHVYHYGWVRPPKQMGEKATQLDVFYSGDVGRSRGAELAKVAASSPWHYDFSSCVPFTGTHPAVMQAWIAAKDWETPAFQPVPWWRNTSLIGGMCRKNVAKLKQQWGQLMRRAA